jgi:hypothetical protein
MYSVFQHWDPLQVCVVGRTYQPEFYDWIKEKSTRQRFQKMAEETEEDYQNLIHILETKFGATTIRPELPKDLSKLKLHDRWVQPPVTPRDYYLMIHDKFWVPSVPNRSHANHVFASQSELSREEFDRRDQAQHNAKLLCYQNIFDLVRSQGNDVCYTDFDVISGCFVSRIGKDLFFATQSYDEDQFVLKQQMDKLFPTTRNTIVNAGGHGDATYCPVTPGLIISLRDIPTYADTFPDWEVVYLPPSNYAHMREFETSMKRTKGRWHMPGFEQDQNLVNMVEYYFDTWVGQVSETVFDVNILIVDPKNIIVSAHNDQVESACARYGINVHVVPFRHKYFWDCGIHCVTNDLSRLGNLETVL